MNAVYVNALEGSDRFLNLVDFTWLRAGMGWWVNLSLLHSDKAYLDECLQRAMTTDSELLRKRSAEMLGLSDPSRRLIHRSSQLWRGSNRHE